MRIAGWGVAVAIMAFVAGPALAHHSRNCRPYTVEKVCWEHGRPCHLHMVYAPGHDPAGNVPDGYWYSAKPGKKVYGHRHHRAKAAHVKHHRKMRHGSVYASRCTFNCWFRHDPQHRY